MSYDVLKEIAQGAGLTKQVQIAVINRAYGAAATKHLKTMLEQHYPLVVIITQSGLAATLRSSRAKHPPYLTIKLDEPQADPHANYMRRVGPSLIQVYEGGEDGLEGTGQGPADGVQPQDQVVLS